MTWRLLALCLMSTPARLMIDPPQAGAWNMAVDEALLKSAATGTTTLRFYQWSEPTLSLGYFQWYSDREAHAASRTCTCVRRSSGGGAILHDLELTYSFATRIESRWPSRLESIYLVFHQALIDVLGDWGVFAETYTPPVREGRRHEPEPFLCFQRRARGDVLLGHTKICGSAQRRQRGAYLQHGSVVLQRSHYAPEIQGIAELSGRKVSTSELVRSWSAKLAPLLEVDWDLGSLASAEHDSALCLMNARFGGSEWLQRR